MNYTTHLLRHLRATIGHNIHHHRAKQKLTLTKLARLSQLPAHKLDHYELGKGEIKLDELLKVACILGVEVKALL